MNMTTKRAFPIQASASRGPKVKKPENPPKPQKKQETKEDKFFTKIKRLVKTIIQRKK